MGDGLTCVAVKNFFSNAKHLKKQGDYPCIFGNSCWSIERCNFIMSTIFFPNDTSKYEFILKERKKIWEKNVNYESELRVGLKVFILLFFWHLCKGLKFFKIGKE